LISSGATFIGRSSLGGQHDSTGPSAEGSFASFSGEHFSSLAKLTLCRCERYPKNRLRKRSPIRLYIENLCVLFYLDLPLLALFGHAGHDMTVAHHCAYDTNLREGCHESKVLLKWYFSLYFLSDYAIAAATISKKSNASGQRRTRPS
jgi:hypothetical protein